jgi:magnesium-transporting ATPase (P-type)
LGRVETYEIKAVFEFNSDRKRMSVVLEGPLPASSSSTLTGSSSSSLPSAVVDCDMRSVALPASRIRMYCKGADNIILARLTSTSDPTPGTDRHEVNTHLSLLAKQGLRTLCVAARTLLPDEYATFAKTYLDATMALEARAAKLDALAETVETDLQLVGITAIEDRLQEMVSESIEQLRSAGIKVWVLTGDKQETAISIGHSSGVLDETMHVIVLDATKEEELVSRLDAILDVFYLHKDDAPSLIQGLMAMAFVQDTPADPVALVTDAAAVQVSVDPTPVSVVPQVPPTSPMSMSSSASFPPASHAAKLALVIDGKTLALALKPSLDFKFFSVASACVSVVCCRCAPLQKAAVVQLVQEQTRLKYGSAAVTLSIGDGANDVPMIQKAHIGVGINDGLEGMAAMFASLSRFLNSYIS